MKLLERFWFLRGVAAALALVQLVPQFTDLTRWEFLRAFNALLSAWDSIAHAIAALIANLPLLEWFSGYDLNTLLFALTFGLPAAYVIVSSGWNPSFLSASRLVKWVWRLGLVVAAILIFFASMAAYVIATSPHVGPRTLSLLDGTPLSARQIVNIGTMFALIIAFLISVVIALVRIRGYARGFLLVATFIATIQVLYLLNAPFVGDFINHWSTRGG